MTSKSRPIVIAHHIMWTLYGWWLPNDLRGSTSRTIRNDFVAELGELHYGRKKVQPAGVDVRRFQAHAADALEFPLLSFGASDFETVASAIEHAVSQRKYTCYACAIMPDHVHLLIRKHRDQAEAMIDKIQVLSRGRLVKEGLRESDHPVWTRGGWKVFLDTTDDVWRTIAYIERNPVKFGLPIQRWGFVKTYDNWPFHDGHSLNSPYVRRLNGRGAGRGAR